MGKIMVPVPRNLTQHKGNTKQSENSLLYLYFFWKLMGIPCSTAEIPPVWLYTYVTASRLRTRLACLRSPNELTFKNSLKSVSSSVFCCNRPAPLS